MCDCNCMCNKNYYVAYDSSNNVVACSVDKEWLKKVCKDMNVRIVNDKDYANCMG